MVSPCQHQRIINTSPHPDDCRPQLRTKGYNHPASAHKKTSRPFFLVAKIFGHKLFLFLIFLRTKEGSGDVFGWDRHLLDGNFLCTWLKFTLPKWKKTKFFLGINIFQVGLTILTFWLDLCCFSLTHNEKNLWSMEKTQSKSFFFCRNFHFFWLPAARELLSEFSIKCLVLPI